MISVQDARNFCLVAAQIVPVLLVATFVADRTLSPTAARGGNREPIRLKTEASIAKARSSIAAVRAATKTAPRRWRPRQKPRAPVNADTLTANEQELDRIEQEVRDARAADANPTLIQRWYQKSLSRLVMTGLVGELSAILGSLGLSTFGYRFPVLVSSTAIIFMLGFMSQAAWLTISAANVAPGGSVKATTGIGGISAIVLLVTAASIGAGIAIYRGPPPAAGGSARPSATPAPRHAAHRPGPVPPVKLGSDLPESLGPRVGEVDEHAKLGL